MSRSADDTRQRRGYRRLADFMAWDPSMAIFPRFQAANNLNLLQLQAEITELEIRLNDAADIDDEAQDPQWRYLSCDFETLKSLGDQSEQWKAFTKLREKLNEYNEALARQILLNNQPSPSPRDFALLQDWMTHPKGGASDLRGSGALTWAADHLGGHSRTGQLALASRNIRTNSLTVWTLKRLLYPLLKFLPAKLTSYLVFMPEENDHTFAIFGTQEGLKSVGDKATSFAASVLVLVPVITLHFVTSADARLCIIVGFTLAFAGMLVSVTEAKRSETFAATAAFVAVQVVYVGSVLNGTA